MAQIDILIERVDGARLSTNASVNQPSNYGLNVSMSEKERSPEALVLSFSLELMSQPQIARLLVSGVATINGSADDIQGVIRASDPNTPPPILLTIYERVYGLLYLVAANLNIPYPMPNLLKAPATEAKK